MSLSIIKPASVAEDAAQAMETLLKTSKYSDATIRCQEYVFKVHRSVICLRSKPIAAAFDGQFKESITGEIDFSEEEPHVIDKVIQFLYTSDFVSNSTRVVHGSVSKRKSTSMELIEPATPKKLLRSSIRDNGTIPDDDSQLSFAVPEPLTSIVSPTDATLSNPQKPKSPQLETPVTKVLVTLAKVYIFAETFDIPALKDLARMKYAANVVKVWNGPSFIESIRLLFDNTPAKVRGMKDVAIKIAQKNLGVLLARADFQTLLKDYGEVGCDLLNLVVPPLPIKAAIPECRIDTDWDDY